MLLNVDVNYVSGISLLPLPLLRENERRGYLWVWRWNSPAGFMAEPQQVKYGDSPVGTLGTKSHLIAEAFTSQVDF